MALSDVWNHTAVDNLTDTVFSNASIVGGERGCWMQMLEAVDAERASGGAEGNWTQLLAQWESFNSFFGYYFDRSIGGWRTTKWSASLFLSVVTPMAFWTVSLVGAVLSGLVFHRRRLQSPTSRLMIADFATDSLAAFLSISVCAFQASTHLHFHSRIEPLVRLEFMVFCAAVMVLKVSDVLALLTNLVELTYSLAPTFSKNICNRMVVILIAAAVYCYSFVRTAFYTHSGIREMYYLENKDIYGWKYADHYFSADYAKISSVFSWFDLSVKSTMAVLYLLVMAHWLVLWRRRRKQNAPPQYNDALTAAVKSHDWRTTLMLLVQCTIILIVEIIAYFLVKIHSNKDYMQRPNLCWPMRQQLEQFPKQWLWLAAAHANNAILAVSVGYYVFPMLLVDPQFRRDLYNVVACRASTTFYSDVNLNQIYEDVTAV